MDFNIPYFSRKSLRVLGMDISSTAVKIVELGLHNHRYRVQSYAVASIPPHAIIENDVKDISALAESIELAYARSESSLKAVAAALPTSAIITKTLQVDATLSESELPEHIQLEAGRYVPYPLEEVSLDFAVLGLNEKEPSKLDILVVAARTEHVESRAEAIRQAGLIPQVIDVESYAIQRICRPGNIGTPRNAIPGPNHAISPDCLTQGNSGTMDRIQDTGSPGSIGIPGQPIPGSDRPI